MTKIWPPAVHEEDFYEDPWDSSQEDAWRVLELEALFPGLHFGRGEGGKPLNWGAVPEQAQGTWQGNPFYYGFRANSGNINVWEDHPSFTPGKLPHLLEPRWIARVHDWVPGEDYLGYTEGIACFKHLLEALEEVPPQKSNHARQGAYMASHYGTPLAGEVEEILPLVFPLKPLEWQESHRLGSRALLTTPAGVTCHLNWYSDGEERFFFDTTLYAPGQDIFFNGEPFAIHRAHLFKGGGLTLGDIITHLETLAQEDEGWVYESVYKKYWSRDFFRQSSQVMEEGSSAFLTYRREAQAQVAAFLKELKGK